MRILVLTGTPESWQNWEILGYEAEVTKCVRVGNDLHCTDHISLRDYDLFLLAGIVSEPVSVIGGSHQNVAPAVNEMLGAGAKLVMFAEGQIIGSGLPVPNQIRTLQRGREVVFAEGATDAEKLRRIASRLSYVMDWSPTPSGFATTKAGREVAARDSSVMTLPLIEGDRRAVVKDLLESDLSWLPAIATADREEHPEWVTAVSWGRLDSARTLVADAERRVSDAIAERENAVSAFHGEARWGDLLWGTGKRVLETRVQEALQELGVVAESFDDLSREDLRVEQGDHVTLIEVTGASGHIGIEKVRQLVQWEDGEYARQAETGASKKISCILLGNPFRLLPPAERTSPPFTQEAVRYARSRRYRLKLTADLFAFVTRADPGRREAADDWLLGEE